MASRSSTGRSTPGSGDPRVPIRPENRDRYPDNRPEIPKSIKERADWRCEGEGGRNSHTGRPQPARTARVRHRLRGILTNRAPRSHAGELRPGQPQGHAPGLQLRYDHARTRAEARRAELAASGQPTFELQASAARSNTYRHWLFRWSPRHTRTRRLRPQPGAVAMGHLIQRLAQTALVLIGVVAPTFVIARLVPRDPAITYEGPRPPTTRRTRRTRPLPRNSTMPRQQNRLDHPTVDDQRSRPPNRNGEAGGLIDSSAQAGSAALREQPLSPCNSRHVRPRPAGNGNTRPGFTPGQRGVRLTPPEAIQGSRRTSSWWPRCPSPN